MQLRWKLRGEACEKRVISSGCFVPSWVGLSEKICGEQCRSEELGLFGWVEREEELMRTWNRGGVCGHEKV